MRSHYFLEFWVDRMRQYGCWILSILDFLESVYLFDHEKEATLFNDISRFAKLIGADINADTGVRDAEARISAMLGALPTSATIGCTLAECEAVYGDFLKMYNQVFDKMLDEKTVSDNAFFAHMKKEEAFDVYARRYDIMNAFGARLAEIVNAYKTDSKNALSADAIA